MTRDEIDASRALCKLAYGQHTWMDHSDDKKKCEHCHTYRKRSRFENPYKAWWRKRVEAAAAKKAKQA